MRASVLSVPKPDSAVHGSTNDDARLVRRQRLHGMDGSGSDVRRADVQLVGVHRCGVVDARRVVALDDVRRLAVRIVSERVGCSCVHGRNRFGSLEPRVVAQCPHVDAPVWFAH